jgi:hypothetical protein
MPFALEQFYTCFLALQYILYVASAFSIDWPCHMIYMTLHGSFILDCLESIRKYGAHCIQLPQKTAVVKSMVEPEYNRRQIHAHAQIDY